MPRKVNPPRRDQTAGVVATPNNGVDWIDRERVAEIAERHGVRDGYDLYAALDQAVMWSLMDTSREHDAPTRDQRRQVLRHMDEYAAGLEAVINDLPFSLYEQIKQHAPDGGWRSRLLDELNVLRGAVAPLGGEANKVAKRTPDRARQNFARSLGGLRALGRILG